MEIDGIYAAPKSLFSMSGYEFGSSLGVNQIKPFIMQEQINFKQQYEAFEFKVLYKKRKPTPIKITSSRDGFEYLLPLFEDEIDYREMFYIICLNRANNIIGHYQISSGGVSGTVADAKMIFSIALKSMASGIILSHNHPSGNLQPSQSDIQLTKNLKASGKLLEISVLDHLILSNDPDGHGQYFSFADEALI